MTDLWPRLAACLEHLAPAVPADALAEADTHRNTLAPRLVAVLDGLVADPTPARADGYVLHLYAMLLLACWRDARAYRPLAALGHLDERIIDEVFGQLVHDTYGRALASTCDGDLAPLTALADDPAASQWARAAALEALLVAALEGRAARTAVIAFLADFGAREAQALRDNPADGEHFQLIDVVAVTAADLGAVELLPAIEAWYREGLIDSSFAEAADIAADIARSPDDCRAALRHKGHGLIDDVAAEVALWPAFHSAPPVRGPALPLGLVREPFVRDGVKVGRNDPCPCGSGRKYKKCHGAAV